MATSFDDLLEIQIENEAAQLYRYDTEGDPGWCGHRKGAGSSGQRFLFADLEKCEVLRKKKRHRYVKCHRASRSNDCQFFPKGAGFMKVRNYVRIGRGRKTNDKFVNIAPPPLMNYDSFCLSETRLDEYGIEDVELVQFLLALQSGADVTPEDYDMLLRLDQVADSNNDTSSRTRKQLADTIFDDDTDNSIDQKNVPAADCSIESDDICPICTVLCSEGPSKTLLCGHSFHIDCLRHWWSTSTKMTCPLDNIDIRDMRPEPNGRVTDPPASPLMCIRL